MIHPSELRAFSHQLRHRVAPTMPLTATFFLFNFGMAFLAPIFSIYVNKITGSFFLTGVFFALWGVIGAVLSLPSGAAADKWGPGRLLRWTLYAQIFVLVGYAFSDQIGALFVTRTAEILSGVVLWAACWTYLRVAPLKRYEEENVRFFYTIQDTAGLAAPIAGGVFFTLYSWDAGFIVAAAMLTAAYFVAFRLNQTEPKRVNLRAVMRRDLRDVRKLGRLSWMLIGLMVLTFTITSGWSSLLTVHLNTNLGIPLEAIGVLLAAGLVPGIILQLPLGAYADRRGAWKLLAVGYGCLVVGMAGMFLARDAVTAGAGMVAVGLGFALAVPTITMALSLHTPKSEAGGALGVAQTAKNIGYIAGPLTAGIAFTLSEFGFFAILAIMAVAALAIVAALPRDRH